MGKVAMKNLNTQKIQLDIVNWASREPYETVTNIEKKIRDRLQRKYKVKVDSKTLEEKIKYYREIYSITSKVLPKYILPSQSGYAELRCVKNKEIKEALRQKFPAEDQKILDSILNWVVEYQYLR